MSLIGQRPNQVPTNQMLGQLAYWGREHFERTVTAMVTSLLTSPFTAGTRMLFQQTAAPTGWTKDTTHDNKALRIVSGTVGSGGSVAFTTAFASRSLTGSVSATTLTSGQMPSHGHRLDVPNSNGQPSSNRLFTGLALNYGTGIYAPQWWGDRAGSNEVTAANTGGGGSHTHGLTLGNVDLAVQYVDVIVAAKD